MSDEEEQYNPKAHKNLLQAISSLGKAQHIGKTTRNEPQLEQDEFRLVKGAPPVALKENGRPIGVGAGDILQVLKKNKKHVNAGKQLKNVQSTKKVLPKPLEKPTADRIKRQIGYEKSKKELERWDAVVTQNRNAETQIFPLKSETIYINTSAYAKPLQLSVKSDLMLEMEATEAKLKALRKERKGDTTDEKALAKREREELQKKHLRDELASRRKELLYLKMRESQQSAKARLKNKIKSKKYHKLLKRQKIQEQLKEFEILQKTNPEAAIEKLNALERSRVLERANLRHKNTGTWAKNLQVRAKYDKDVRKDLAEQLQLSREITQKKEDDDDSDAEMEIKSKLSLPQEKADESFDPFNPWTQADANGSGKNGQESEQDQENWRKYWIERNDNEKKLEAYTSGIKNDENSKMLDESTDDEEVIERKIQVPAKKKQTVKKVKGKIISIKAEKKKGKVKDKDNSLEKKIDKKKVIVTNDSPKKVAEKKKVKKEQKKKGKITNDSSEQKTTAETESEFDIDALFDLKEDELRNTLSKKLKRLTKEATKINNAKVNQKKTKLEKDNLKNLKDLSFKSDLKKKPIIDEELTYEGSKIDEKDINEAVVKKTTNVTNNDVTKSQPKASALVDTIDPNVVTTVKLRQPIIGIDMITDSLEDIGMDEIDENPNEIRNMTITEAFEDDDIVADFTKEKTNNSTLKNAKIELSMPGWGSWAGCGLSKGYNKRNKRFVLDLGKKLAEEQAKRRDENKGNVYINEEVSKSLRTHLVSDLPFPFTSVKDYEASIRAPLGRNFVPETAFRMLTRPAVISKKGKIIEAMDESELVKAPPRLRHVVDRRIAQAAKASK